MNTFLATVQSALRSGCAKRENTEQKQRIGASFTRRQESVPGLLAEQELAAGQLPFLKFDHVRAGYGLGDVLNELSFELSAGKILGVVGPNGSGKTTMLNVLAGTLRPDAGQVYMAGLDITRLSVEERARLGIGRTFQIPRPFPKMTVYENVLTARVFAAGLPEREAEGSVLDLLKITGLFEKRNCLARSLPLLDRKRLEIARASAGNPKLLLLDEVAAGLTGLEVRQLIDLIFHLKSESITVVWIEHVLDVMSYAVDLLMCMADGRNVVYGKPGEVLHSSIVEELYLGRRMEEDHAQA